MKNFDWQTEEDEKAAPAADVQKTARGVRRSAVFFSILLVFLAAAFTVTLRLINKADLQEKQVEFDIISTYKIWKEAVGQLDRELLNSITVGDSPHWIAVQRELLDTGLFIERPGYGLKAKLPLSIPEIPTYKLSDDWRRADLFFSQAYYPESSGGRGEPVMLTHTVGFRRDGSRWLYSNLDESFWGDIETRELENLIVRFPERDREIVGRIAGDLDDEIALTCQEVFNSPCLLNEKVELTFDTDPSTLLKVSDPDLPMFKSKAFNLPSPTILGLPDDGFSYSVIYEAYSKPIISAFEASLSSPIPFPDQNLELLCYSDFGARPRLFGYDASADRWTVTMPERSFQFLSTLANDEGLLLQEYPTSRDADYFSLVSWSAADRQLLFDYGMSAIRAFPAGDFTLLNQPDILFSTVSTRQENIQFTMVDGSMCSDDGCETIELDGFPIWSPNGQRTLLWQNGSVSLGDSDGKSETALSEGFSPFWINDSQFGLAQFVESAEGSEVMLFTAGIDNPELTPLAASRDFAEYVGLNESSSFFVQLIAPRPKHLNELVVLAREYAGRDSRYFLLKAEISIDDGKVEISKAEEITEIRGAPGSYPSALTPTGQIPFVFSSDGNYLTIGRKADSDLHYWEIHVFGLDSLSHQIYQTSYPAHTFLHPYFDWSLDSEWLAVVDDGFIQLISPSNDYRRLIAHDLHACTHAAWVNKE